MIESPMDDEIEGCRDLAIDSANKMAAMGFMCVGVICYKADAGSDNDAVKVACPIDFYKNRHMKIVVIRMLRNAATILEAGGDDRTVMKL